jgi:anthranilate phosphoribosyltransferase
MREKAVRVRAPAGCIDTCGTGGDGKATLNISTAAAFVAAGAGAVVAKHGNRAVSSSSGSADVLAALGVNTEAPVETVERCLEEAKIGFLYAPMLHKAMKYAIGPRRELGARTVFNVLGPLTNPAGASAQLLGVYDPALCRTLAEVLGRLGSARAWVVSSDDGLDEISTAAPTRVAALARGEVTETELDPSEYGLKAVAAGDLAVKSAAESASIIRAILSGEKLPQRDVVLANAAAAIHVAGKARDFEQGLVLAAESIDSGRARGALEKLARMTSAAPRPDARKG